MDEQIEDLEAVAEEAADKYMRRNAEFADPLEAALYGLQVMLRVQYPRAKGARQRAAMGQGDGSNG